MIEYILYFIIGGIIVTSSILLARIGHPILGGVLMVLPNLSLVGFYFINKTSGSNAVISTVKSSLIGTVFIWPIYMISLLYFIPKIGVNKALLIGVLISVILAVIFLLLWKYTFISIWLK